MDLKVRAISRDIISGLRCCNDTQSVVKWFQAAKFLLLDCRTDTKFIPQCLLSHVNNIEIQQLRKFFILNHFSRVCNEILRLLTIDFVQLLPGNFYRDNVESFFLSGPSTSVLFELSYAIKSFRNEGYKLHRAISLLEVFIQKNKLLDLIWEQCQVSETHNEPQSGDNGFWDELVLIIVYLPSNMANILNKENSDVFLPQHYVPGIAHNILECLRRCHDALVNSTDCSLEFVCRLLGKLCFSGYAELLMDIIVHVLSTSVIKDYTWCRICERVFTGIQPLFVESVFVPLFCRVSWYKLVEKFIGDSVIKCQKVSFLLCTKLLFHRFFSQNLLLQNVIGYLASSSTRYNLYIEVFQNLLEVWSDAGTLRHVSSQQHNFLCRALIVCISHAGSVDKACCRDLIQLLLSGVQGHLSSTDPDVPFRGMLVAQLLTGKLDPSGVQIEFEIPNTAEVEELSKLAVIPVGPISEEAEFTSSSACISAAEDENDAEEALTEQNQEEFSTEHLDSDDDLVPYDMSCDKKQRRTTAPRYIRDCMEVISVLCGLIEKGLLNTEDIDKFEASVESAESLIRACPDGLIEIAAEWTQIFLHMTDGRCVSDFTGIRTRAMVALAVSCPEPVANYLTGQFYERNYNIRQRLDILEVLSSAALELSKPDASKSVNDGASITSLDLKVSVAEPNTWRSVVQRRIDSKTRRFSKRPSQSEAVLSLNRFGNVAGCFFYPLMRLCNREERLSLDLLGRDNLVLHRLIYTLSVVLHAAVNTMAANAMGKTLLEFTSSLRQHCDACVRQAVLVATSFILMTVSVSYIANCLPLEIMETKKWLEEVCELDVNVECQRLASQCCFLLQSLIGKWMYN